MDLSEGYQSMADPLLQQSEALHNSIAKALEELRTLKNALDQQKSDLIARDALIENQTKDLHSRNDEISRLKAELERSKDGLEPKQTSDEAAPEELPDHVKIKSMIVELDDGEYVKKTDYDSLLIYQRQTATKYHNVRKREKHTNGRLEKEEDRTRRLRTRFQQLTADYDLASAKLATFEERFERDKKASDVRREAIERIGKKEIRSKRRYEIWKENLDSWKGEVLKRETIPDSVFESFPKLVEWPEYGAWLKGLEKIDSVYQGFGFTPSTIAKSTAGDEQKTPSLLAPKVEPIIPDEAKPSIPLLPHPDPTQAPPETPIREYIYEDPDATSDEEPESALQNFSPTTKAIMRKPGAETLAVLHPEPFSPSQAPRSVRKRKADAAGTRQSPVFIKSEPNSEADWYGKYGYSRLVTSDQDSIDLDNVPGLRRGNGNDNQGLQPNNSATRAREMSMSQDAGRKHFQERLARLTEEELTQDRQDVGLEPALPNDIEAVPVAQAEATPVSNNNIITNMEKNVDYDMVDDTDVSQTQANRDPLKEIPQPNRILRSTATPAPKATSKNESITTKVPISDKTKPKAAKATPRARTADPSTESPNGKRQSTEALDSVRRSKRAKTAAATAPSTTKNAAAANSKMKSNPISDNPFSPSKYRINPAKNDGFDYAFSEVVREKSKKNCLPSCVKECCKDLADGKLHDMWQPPKRYEAPRFAADSSPPSQNENEDAEGGEKATHAENNAGYKDWRATIDKSERHLQYGRHRAQHEKAAEPLHFWESDFPTETQLEEQRQDSERRYREKGYKRYEDAKKGGLFERRV